MNGTGTPWLATAGTGDVLRASPVPCWRPAWDAALAGAVAAHLHGRTGQLAAECGPLIAGDLRRRLPEAIGRVRGLGGPRLGHSGT